MWFPNALIVTLALVGPVIPIAGTGSAADFVLISESDTVPDDLYAAGNVVDVRGTIQGDLTATASQRVIVSGTVEGDVVAIAPLVEITGDVEGSVRVIADRIRIVGTVGDDVVIAGRIATIQGVVDRDVMLFVYSARLTGSVTDNFQAFASGVIEIVGGVGHDLEVNARRLEVASTATVGGDVRYRGEASIDDNADLASSAIQLGKTPVPLRVRALVLVGQVVAGLVVLLAGLALFWLAPRTTAAATGAIRNWLWAAMVGLATLALPAVLIGAIIGGMGVASPDLYGVAILATSPIILLYLGLVMFMAVLGFVPMAASLGRIATRGRISNVGSFVLGVVLLGVITAIPVVGFPILAALWMVGVGGWALGAGSLRGRSVA
ncbi:MAG: hypothetical protein OEY55_06205 [Acidimicrobiia bacterium]|nr:hypothetical protein [Acidimicrobiia bacterium]MDH5502748.1 hypothetical protein [Acidimicrobiia bacterium]